MINPRLTVGNKNYTNREANIHKWLEDEEINLDDMYEKCDENNYTNNLTETRETLMDFICHSVEHGNLVALLLQSIEDTSDADYYAFDTTGHSNVPAEAIYGKNKLAEILLQ